MSLAQADLPHDPTVLRTFAAALQAEMRREIAARDAEIYAKTLHIEKVKVQLAVLRRARFGRSSEKLDAEIEQLELLIGDLEESHSESQAREDAGAPAKPAPHGKGQRERPRRKPLPDHLPREFVVREPVSSCPCCGGTLFSKIGGDEREVLEYVPSFFERVVHVRPKMSCRGCETIVQAPMPSLPIERGRPGPALLAHVVVSKYCDHAPLHRQSAIYARAGVDLDRSTMADWIGYLAFLLGSLAEAIGRHCRAGPTIHADNTPVPVLAPGLGKTKTGRLWVVVRDERSWGSTAPPAAFYMYSPDRKGEHAVNLLGSCRGFLHADGYGGFGKLYECVDPDTGEALLREVACWAHARRYLYDVCVATGSTAAHEALERIAALFAIEAEIRGQQPESRFAMREKKSAHLLTDLKAFLTATLCSVALGSALPLHLRRAAGNGEQRRRARNQATGSICGLRRGRTTSRDHVHDHRDGEDDSPRPRGLSGRCRRPHRRSSRQSDRRAFALELEPKRK
jgi:transposase